MKNQRIIHITGYSGSGKSTIGQKLSASGKYTVYDTDEIAENVHKELFRKFPKLFQMNESRYWKRYHEMIRTFVNSQRTKTKKDIVIVGFAIDVIRLVKPLKIEGYILDVDKKVIYRRRALRDLHFLCDNRKRIEKIITTTPVEAIEQKLWNEGVHQQFPPPPFKHAFNFPLVDPKDEHYYVHITPRELLKNLL